MAMRSMQVLLSTGCTLPLPAAGDYMMRWKSITSRISLIFSI